MKEILLKWKELIVLVIIIFITITLIVIRKGDKPFKKVDIQTSNHITNLTAKPYVDTILVAGIKELGIENTFIVVKTLENTEKEFADIVYDLKGHIVNSGNQYIIYVIDTNKDNTIEILSHELIHMKQFYTKELEIKKINVVWRNKIYDGINIPYDQRPWELDASSREDSLKEKMQEFLYVN